MTAPSTGADDTARSHGGAPDATPAQARTGSIEAVRAGASDTTATGAAARSDTEAVDSHRLGIEDADVRRLAWVYLSRVVEGPCAALSSLIESVGVVEAARAVRECALPEVLRGPTEARRGIDRAEADMALMARLGGRVVTPDDEEWPAWRMLGLRQLDPEQDEAAAVPLVLWVRGPRSLMECTERAVAVVGARCSTGYGNHATGEIAGELAVRGWTVVSGAAFGIDGMAHRAALGVGGCTIAVLGCGVDRPYPVQHDQLLAEIATSGLVVSEYPPGTSARKHHFLARNRLIAALADTVVVVEAGARSGARNTVKWTRRLGRPALAVPGPITSAASVGCHRMIRDGEAFLVTSAADILDEAGPLRLSLPTTVSAAPEDDLSDEEALVYAALPAAGARVARSLIAETGLSLAAVRATLTALEIAGLIACDDSGWYRLAQSTTRGAPAIVAERDRNRRGRDRGTVSGAGA
ncbi:DNA-processing protein DprA [Nocardia acidivorans]|uniref:DNA-processing protein DprA n=1 Tax=Nocardia acidivorans TaxID=404580 RepID=UPI0009FCBA2B